MDGQNFNENGLSTATDTGYTPEPTAEPAAEPTAAPASEYSYENNFYDNSSSQETTTGSTYSDPVYTSDPYTADPYGTPVAEAPATPGTAIASLVLGIISILCCCGGIIFGGIGLFLGISANKKIKTGIGTAGIVCSSVGIGFGCISLIYYIIMFVAAIMGA